MIIFFKKIVKAYFLFSKKSKVSVSNIFLFNLEKVFFSGIGGTIIPLNSF